MMRGVADPRDTQSLRVLLAELGQEAHEYRFEVAPNPCVGAALLDVAGNELARGYHTRWAGPHAEPSTFECADAAGVDRGAWDTLVITLEPCSTQGKTPPCVEAIANSGIKTVVVGALDPDPRHQGRGIELLRERGVDVLLLEGASPLSVVSPHFLRWTSHERLRRPRPWMVAKWAQTLSGQLSPPPDVGNGQWISGPEALVEVQVLRSRVDAIVTGVGTVVADNPRFSVRSPHTTDNPPRRIVLDGLLRTPPESRLFHTPGEGEVAGPVDLLCVAGADPVRAHALEAAGARLHGLHGGELHRLDLRGVQSWLWDQGLHRVLIEAGPTLLQAYFEAGFVDQVRIVTSDVRGGRGPSLGPWLAGARMEERLDREVGNDSVLEAFLKDGF